MIENIKSNDNIKRYIFGMNGKVYDYGSQINEIVIEFDKKIKDKSVKIDTFEVLDSGVKRNIKSIEIYNNRISLKLEVGQKFPTTLYWNEEKFSNELKKLKCNLRLLKSIYTVDDEEISPQNSQFSMEKLKIEDIDKFDCGESFGLKYRDYKPMNDGRIHPLIIWIHGAGEGGNSNITQILGNRGGVAFVSSKNQEILDKPYVLVPQCPTFWINNFTVEGKELKGEKDYTLDLLSLVEEYIRKNSNIDRNRIYIGGCSMGGYQGLKVMSLNPKLFAAGFITCPAKMINYEQLDKIKDIPLWLIHAREDDVVSVENSRKTYEYLKNVGGIVEYTEYKDVIIANEKYTPHASYFYTLNNIPKNLKGENIFQWIAAKKRS